MFPMKESHTLIISLAKCIYVYRNGRNRTVVNLDMKTPLSQWKDF